MTTITPRGSAPPGEIPNQIVEIASFSVVSGQYSVQLTSKKGMRGRGAGVLATRLSKFIAVK
jgi:hypothetical protein